MSLIRAVASVRSGPLPGKSCSFTVAFPFFCSLVDTWPTWRPDIRTSDRSAIWAASSNWALIS